MELRYYKNNKNAFDVSPETKWSACFDLKACLKGTKTVNLYTSRNVKMEMPVIGGTVSIGPGSRALIPTGLIFDLDEGTSVRVHPRSGLSVKKGIKLSNSEGVIDADYVNEAFITVWNSSDCAYEIAHGDRLAQAELIKLPVYSIKETYTKPSQKTDRMGGFGSTGK